MEFWDTPGCLSLKNITLRINLQVLQDAFYPYPYIQSRCQTFGLYLVQTMQQAENQASNPLF